MLFGIAAGAEGNPRSADATNLANARGGLSVAQRIQTEAEESLTDIDSQGHALHGRRRAWLVLLVSVALGI